MFDEGPYFICEVQCMTIKLIYFRKFLRDSSRLWSSGRWFITYMNLPSEFSTDLGHVARPLALYILVDGQQMACIHSPTVYSPAVAAW